MAATRSTDTDQVNYQQGWYESDIVTAPPEIRKLLETYSKVPAEEVVKHVNKIRQRGFEANPYPCIGQYKFLNLTLLSHPKYSEIVQKLHHEPDTRYLDLGCCFGQDLRQLVADGVPSTKLVGADIEGKSNFDAGPLMELGYELFLDRQTLASQFFVLDVFEGAKQDAWRKLESKKFDIIHCSAFFHLFPLATQLEAAKNIVRLVRPGGLIVGRQLGRVEPAELPAIRAGTTSFRHNVPSFQELWDQAGAATGTRWQVDGNLDMVGVKQSPVEDQLSRRLLFTVRRLAD